MATLPELTRTIDNDFVNTWYEIRAEVIDNIMEATPLWLALNNFGSINTQVGGEFVTRTVGYGRKSTQRIQKGSNLSQSEKQTDTMGIWDWRHYIVDVNRSVIDDQKNAGEFKIKDYIGRRLEVARNALVEDLETYLFQYGAYYAAPEQPNGLYDICTPEATATLSGGNAAYDAFDSGVSNGGINRSNTWWRNWIMKSGETYNKTNKNGGPTVAPYDLNMVADMRTGFNLATSNQESPNFILCDRNLYESYEDEAADKQQIVISQFTRTLIDLGFDGFTFKGATMTWSDKLDGTLEMFMLNMNYVEFVYDPNMWFDMTGWKEGTNQLERVAYIMCATPGLITTQPRRHMHLEWAS
jgi:hypothetical protein